MIQLTTQADDFLVPLIDVKRHIRVDADFDDSLIYGYIQQAQLAIQKYTNRAMTVNTYKYIDSADMQDYDLAYNVGLMDRVQIQVGKIVELTSITTYDKDGNATVKTLTDFTFINYDQFSEIVVKDGSTFPYGTRAYAPLEIVFTAGYTEETCPALLKLAIMQLVSVWYENRETIEAGSISHLPMGIKDIMNQYKIMVI